MCSCPLKLWLLLSVLFALIFDDDRISTICPLELVAGIDKIPVVLVNAVAEFDGCMPAVVDVVCSKF